MIENAFGILVSRWKILEKPIQANPDTVEKIVLACVVLHNFLMVENPQEYALKQFADHIGPDGRTVEGGWRGATSKESMFSGLQPFETGIVHTTEAKEVRQCLIDHYNNEGRVSWQYEVVGNDGRVYLIKYGNKLYE